MELMRKARIQILETFPSRVVNRMKISMMKHITIQVLVITIQLSDITILNRAWDTQMTVNQRVISLIIDVYIF